MIGKQDIECLSQCFEFVNTFDEALRQQFYTQFVSITYPKGKRIDPHKNECEGLLFVKSGQIRAYMMTELGKEITLYRLLERDVCVFSASCIFKNINFSVFLELEKDSELLLMPSHAFKKLQEESSQVKQFSLDLMSSRFTDVMWVIEELISKPISERIIDFLVEQRALQQSDEIKTTHEMIAKNIGSAREVVSRTLKKMQRDGVIDSTRGKIRLL